MGGGASGLEVGSVMWQEFIGSCGRLLGACCYLNARVEGGPEFLIFGEETDFPNVMTLLSYFFKGSEAAKMCQFSGALPSLMARSQSGLGCGASGLSLELAPPHPQLRCPVAQA